MLLSKTPFRISFAGGGSDYFNNSSDAKGRVLVTTIDKYIYVALNERYNDEYRISYSETEITKSLKKIKHEIIRNTLQFYKINNGMEIVTIADIPSSGSGLASSSALTVGLVNLLNRYKNKKISKKNMAEQACLIEINKCKKPIGMQDQYSTTFGGLNRFEFYNNKVKIKKILLKKTCKKILIIIYICSIQALTEKRAKFF